MLPPVPWLPTALQLLGLSQPIELKALMAVPEFSDTSSLLLATSAGAIKRLPLAAFAKRRKDGLAAINLAAGDEVCAGGGCLAVGCQCLLSVTPMAQALQWCCGLQTLAHAQSPCYSPYRPSPGMSHKPQGHPNRPDVAAVILTATAHLHLTTACLQPRCARTAPQPCWPAARGVCCTCPPLCCGSGGAPPGPSRCGVGVY